MYDNSEKVRIHFKIRAVDDILKHFDYRYLNERKINLELEDYIFKEVKCYPLRKKVILVVHICSSDSKSKNMLIEIIHNHFRSKVKETELLLKHELSQWRINMFIGMLFLILCLILVKIFEAFSYIYVFNIIKESLLIIGWVAIWEPLTFILFGWQPIRENILYYKKLCKVAVNIEEWNGSKVNFQ
jgi:hypothetical protein